MTMFDEPCGTLYAWVWGLIVGAFMLAVALVLVGIAVLFWLLYGTGSAIAHGDGQWIADGNYKNAANELCCGKRDCFSLDSADVLVTRIGFYIKSIKETVPYHEATPSPDGKYWRCQWGGRRKCFFAPPGLT